MTRTQARACATCGTVESRDLATSDAYFVERRAWNSPCSDCGGTTFETTAVVTPPLTAQALEEWSNNEKLTLSPDNEHIFLAMSAPLDLLKAFVQDPDLSASKRATILAALCFILQSSRYTDVAPGHPDAANVIDFLKRQSHLFKELGDQPSSRYIENDVLATLELRSPTAKD